MAKIVTETGSHDGALPHAPVSAGRGVVQKFTDFFYIAVLIFRYTFGLID